MKMVWDNNACDNPIVMIVSLSIKNIFLTKNRKRRTIFMPKTRCKVGATLKKRFKYVICLKQQELLIGVMKL